MLLTLLAIVIGGAATVAALAFLRVIEPEKLAFWREKLRPIPTDWVAIPRCARPIEPYTKITAEYLTNPLTGRWLVTYVPPERPRNGVIVEPRTILFRVTAYEKKAGLFFSEADFLPRAPALVSRAARPRARKRLPWMPAGSRASCMTCAGDHVVLQASTAVDMPGAGHSNGGRFGGNVVGLPRCSCDPSEVSLRR